MTPQDYEEYKRLIERSDLWKENRLLKKNLVRPYVNL